MCKKGSDMLQKAGYLILLLTTFLINSCSTSCGSANVNPCNPCIVGTPVPPFCPSPNLCTIQICKEPIICTIPERNRRIAYLIQHGVKIIHVGETITLVLPSDRVFYPDSANINPCFQETLRIISEYIFCYEKQSVRVAAYTDNTCSPFRNEIMTQAQAQIIAKSLWCGGIDARLLYAQGFGSAFPIASNATQIGRAQNRRIEICFRYIPPYTESC